MSFMHSSAKVENYENAQITSRTKLVPREILKSSKINHVSLIIFRDTRFNTSVSLPVLF